MDQAPKSIFQAHVKVYGRVQGVGFRYYVKDDADTKNVKGWVKNCYDGSVEAVFQGTKDTVEYMVSSVREGPPLSKVSKVDVEWEPPDEYLKGFEITS